MERFLQVVVDGVAELVGPLVGLAAGVAHEVGEQPLDDPVLADDPLGARAAGGVSRDSVQSSALGGVLEVGRMARRFIEGGGGGEISPPPL